MQEFSAISPSLDQCTATGKGTLGIGYLIYLYFLLI